MKMLPSAIDNLSQIIIPPKLLPPFLIDNSSPSPHSLENDDQTQSDDQTHHYTIFSNIVAPSSFSEPFAFRGAGLRLIFKVLKYSTTQVVTVSMR